MASRNRGGAGGHAVRTARSWRGIVAFTHPRTGGAHDALCRPRQSQQSACRVRHQGDAQASAKAIGRQIEILTASTNREIDAAFASLVQKRAEALLIGPDVFFTNRRVQLATLAVRHGVPAIYSFREFAEAGGLMSYGTSNADRDRQVGVYAGRILKGEKPADLPVLQPAKFEFVINLQTARTLGLDVPATLLARADEVIE